MVLEQGCTNPRHQVAVMTKFCFVAAKYLWVLTMGFVSCQLSGMLNFEMASRFLGNLCLFVRGYITLLLSVPYHFFI